MNTVPVTTQAIFEFKSATLPLVSLLLKSADLIELSIELHNRLSGTPDFFADDLLVIDLSLLQHNAVIPDFLALQTLLRSYHLRPIAVRAGNPKQIAAAVASGLLDAPDIVPQQSRSEPIIQEVIREIPAPNALIIDRPLRSGQQVYARGTSIVVLALVSYGAEVIADGHIHVYAPLRGKAIAGARGNTEARIFSTCMEAELVSIAGIYRTAELPLPRDVMSKAAQIRLLGEKLLIESI